MQKYLVGGAVRDQLLGLPISERDWVVVGSTPEAMQALGYQVVGKDFPVFLHPRTKEEYALARTERKVAKGYQGFEFNADPSVSLIDDLARRDFTMNAIAEDESGQLIDPYHGRQDIEQRLIRHVTAAFSEDPVRILRAGRFMARFASLGFSLAPETLALMRQMVKAGEVDALVPERIWQELLRALSYEQPQQFFQVLDACGALDILFPEFKAISDPSLLLPTTKALGRESNFSICFVMALQAEDVTKQLVSLKAFSQRYPLPKNFFQLTHAVIQGLHLCLAKREQVTASDLLQILEKLDAFRRPQLLDKVIAVLKQLDTPKQLPLVLLGKAYIAAAAISGKAFAAKGYQGQEIAKKLHEKRLMTIEQQLF